MVYVFCRHVVILVAAGSIIAECLPHVFEHIDIIDYDAACLVRIHTVRTCDGLHQGVPFHGLVEIERAERGYIESREPHRTDEHQLQRIIRVFEAVFYIFAFRCYLVHLLAVDSDIEPLFLEFLLFLCILADHYRHFHAVHIIEYIRQSHSFFLSLGLIALQNNGFLLLCPVMLHFVVHLYRRVFIHAHHHSFSSETSSGEMVCDVFGNLIQTLISFDDL